MKLRSGSNTVGYEPELKRKIVKRKQIKEKSIKTREIRVVLTRLTREELSNILPQLRAYSRSVPTNEVNLMENRDNFDENRRENREIGPQLPLNAEEFQRALNAQLPDFNDEQQQQQRQPGEVNEAQPVPNEQQQIQQQQQVRNTRTMSELCARPEKLRVDVCLAEDWKKFKRQFSTYLIATETDQKNDSVKVAMFLNLIGDDAYTVYESLGIREADRQNYNVVVKAMEDFCQQRKNTVYERYAFYERKQKDGEPFNTFFMDIKRLVRTCDFGDRENEMLRDRIVMGIAEKRLQTKLLATTNLDYDTAVEKCRAHEITQEQAKQMSKTVAVNEVRTKQKQSKAEKGNNNNNNNRQNKSSNNTRSDAQSMHNGSNNNNKNNNDNKKQNSNSIDITNCKYCGYNHKSRECPAYGKNCNTCNRANHFSKVCRTRSVSTIEKVNSDTCSTDSDNHEFYIGTVDTRRETDADYFMSPWLEKVGIYNNDISFKIDTGADMDVMPLSVFKRCFPRAELRRVDFTLRAFGGQKIEPVGMCYLPCRYRNVSLNVLIAVVDINIIPILGLLTSARFGIVNPPRTKHNNTRMTKNSL